MVKDLLFPDYVFESSWEVCNKVGGIYTVLSTRAKTLQDALQDRIIFIGPDCWTTKESPYFREDPTLFGDWKSHAKEDGINIRIGRWNIPGEPIAVLVDFTPYFSKKDEIYGKLWECYQVDSLHAYGDYDEASMFSYAAALVVESFYKFYLDDTKKVIYHGNEWMTGLGLLYINQYLPLVETISVSSPKSVPIKAFATSNKRLRASLRLRVKVAPLGTKWFSKPLGNTTSTGLSNSSTHSLAVISLTVVKQSTCLAVCFSMECLLWTFNSADIWSPL